MDPAFHELRPWNEGRLLGAKRPLKPQQVWAIRFSIEKAVVYAALAVWSAPRHK